MNDKFILWFCLFYFIAQVIGLFFWLWRNFPLGFVLLAGTVFWVSWLVVRDRRLRHKRGWWIEDVGPGQLGEGKSDWATVYHEGKNWHYFCGTLRPNMLPVLRIPSAVTWERDVPEWMHGRRDVVLERLVQGLNENRPAKNRVEFIETDN